ncbi:histidinol dehydrogenase, partial [Allopontixanthobacter sp.]|uniref:histidinol dehydrogenase n=1 Tax=Allopontixanthobacter sp. TaxID=2906452 RepID=UPI002ABA3FBE
MKMLRTVDEGFEKAFTKIVNDRRESDDNVAQDVASILAEVRRRGDAALAEYTARFDDHRLTTDEDWRVPAETCRAAFEALDDELRDALILAADRIRDYHTAQLPQDRDYTDAAGMRLGARWLPVDAAGLYVPGGRAAYPSSLLMNAIPAKVAGVARLVAVTPTPKGVTNPLVLAAEHVELAIDDPDVMFAKIRHAGSVFLGRHTPEAIGDYVAGPNHVL